MVGMAKNLFYFIFRDKPVRALLALLEAKQESYASRLAKEIDCTYPHLVKILAHFKAQGIVQISSNGRVKPIQLTDEGKKIARKIRELRALVGQE